MKQRHDRALRRMSTLGMDTQLIERVCKAMQKYCPEDSQLGLSNFFFFFFFFWSAEYCLSTSDVPSRLSPFGLEPLLTAQRTGGTSERKIP